MLETGRKPTDKEAEMMTRNLLGNADIIYQLTQMKVSLRLMRDDETIDKELLKYAELSVTKRFNVALKEAVPLDHTSVKQKTLGESASLITDPLLLKLLKGRYLAILPEEKTVMPLENLLLTMDRVDTEVGGWRLDYTLPNGNAAWLLSKLSKGEGGRYIVRCGKCDKTFMGIVKKSHSATIRTLTCSNCKDPIVRLVTASDSKVDDENTPDPTLG